MNALLVVNVATAWFLTGLIWTIQVVHYPLFAFVGERFCDYEARHIRRIGYIVGPTMLLEIVAAVLLVWLRPAYVSQLTAILALGLVALIWISTAVLQSPCHRILARGWNSTAERRLTTTNWFRTTAWTLRAILLTTALLEGLP